MNFNGNGIAKLIADTHFNPERPENHNIRMNSKKYKTMRVMEDRWHIKSNDEVVENLMKKYKNMLFLRLLTPEFQGSLKHETDFTQIQTDLMSLDKNHNPQTYYNTARRIYAALDDLEYYYHQHVKNNRLQE